MGSRDARNYSLHDVEMPWIRRTFLPEAGPNSSEKVNMSSQSLEYKVYKGLRDEEHAPADSRAA